MRNIWKILSGTLLLMVGAIALLKLFDFKNETLTPDVEGLLFADFYHLEKLGEDRMEGLSVVQAESGMFYLYNNKRIYQLNSRGEVIKKIDLAKKIKSQESYITSMCMEGSEKFYLADAGAGKVHVVDVNDGVPEVSELSIKVKRPIAISAGSGVLYVFDAGDGLLKKFSRDGKPVASYELTYKNKRTEFVNDIEPYRNGQVLILSDSNNGRVMFFDARREKIVREVAGFTHPRGITLANGKIAVADTFGSSVSVIDLNGRIVERLEVPKEILEEGFFPFGVAFDGRTKTLICTDRVFGRIYLWRAN